MIKEQIKKIISSKFLKYFKIFIGITIFVLFIKSIDTGGVVKLIEKIDFWDVLVLLFLTVIRNVIGAFRFKLLIKKISDLSLFKIMNQYFVASLYNNFLPTALGGDTIRMLMLSKEGLDKKKSIIYVVTERIIGFYALLFIGYFSSIFWVLPGKLSQIITISFLVYSLVLFGFLIINFKTELLFLEKIHRVFKEIKSNKLNILYVFIISVIYQLVSIFVSYYIGIAIGLKGYFLEFLTLVPIVWFLTMIPFSFGGIGIREVSFAYLLGLVGISSEQATIISIGTYFTLLLSGIIGGILILRNISKVKANKI